MDDLLELVEKPVAKEMFMIAGWRQWADAGEVSSGLPQYLIEQTGAKKIGEIKSDQFYLFQIPGTHHLLRPVVKIEEGYRQELGLQKNEFFYAEVNQKGLLIFLGEEPHRDVDRYAEAFFGAVKELGITKIAALGGVHGPVPYDKDRQITCVYSLPRMKEELDKYAVKFSDYQGGSSIGTYFAHLAEQRELEYLSFYALVPHYDLEYLSIRFTGIQIEKDFKAWCDILRRFNHMFGLGIELSSLERKSKQLVSIVDAQIDELDNKAPQIKIREYIEEMSRDFTEMTFRPLSELWERELRDLFGD
jgi:proteasome assembly chaperone (PAC2) family protein